MVQLHFKTCDDMTDNKITGTTVNALKNKQNRLKHSKNNFDQNIMIMP